MNGVLREISYYRNNINTREYREYNMDGTLKI
jgi:hypothetical protein